jgi:ketosteroid isomerase-like protein
VPPAPASDADLEASPASFAAERDESLDRRRRSRRRPNPLLPIVAAGLLVLAVGLSAVVWRAQQQPPELTFGTPAAPEDFTAAAPTTPPAEDTGPPPPADTEPAAEVPAPPSVPEPAPLAQKPPDEPPAVAANGVPTVEAAREIVDAYVEAYEARDVDALVALFANDARQNGRVGREMIGAEYRRAFAQLAETRYEIEDLEVEERDSSLVLRGPFEIAYRYVSGGSGTMQGTASWEISTRDGEPRIVTFDYDLG